jgi:YggT family protein
MTGTILLQIIDLIFTFLYLAILARILLSWVRVDPYHPAAMFLFRITEPILAPFRNIIPPIGMLDISPIVAIIVLGVVQQVLVFIVRGL